LLLKFHLDIEDNLTLPKPEVNQKEGNHQAGGLKPAARLALRSAQYSDPSLIPQAGNHKPISLFPPHSLSSFPTVEFQFASR
jgi:hypothetical protein